MLDETYLREAEYRARRFSGAYFGTSGTLAADVIRLLNLIRHQKQELARMTTTLDQANEELRAAVEARLAQGCAADAACCESPEPEETFDPAATIPVDWILRGERELHDEEGPRLMGDGILAAQAEEEPANAAEELLRDTMHEVRDRRPKYGGPKKHFARTVGMINAAFADVLKRPLTTSDWALIMTLDKVARFLGPTKTRDQIVDIAGYAACLAECEQV
jgi:hypothetical protein